MELDLEQKAVELIFNSDKTNVKLGLQLYFGAICGENFNLFLSKINRVYLKKFASKCNKIFLKNGNGYLDIEIRIYNNDNLFIYIDLIYNNIKVKEYKVYIKEISIFSLPNSPTHTLSICSIIEDFKMILDYQIKEIDVFDNLDTLLLSLWDNFFLNLRDKITELLTAPYFVIDP